MTLGSAFKALVTYRNTLISMFKKGVFKEDRTMQSLKNFSKYESFVNASSKDGDIPADAYPHVQNQLVLALMNDGQVEKAFKTHEQTIKNGYDIVPKTTLNLIRKIRSGGQLPRLMSLLKHLEAYEDIYVLGCHRIVSYCVTEKLPREAVSILNLRLEKRPIESKSEWANLFDGFFSQIDDEEFGLEFLKSIKENVGIEPQRKSLDCLISACIAKDPTRDEEVWGNYLTVKLKFNEMSRLWFFISCMANGKYELAYKVSYPLRRLDKHINVLIYEIEKHYGISTYTDPPTIGNTIGPKLVMEKENEYGEPEN